MLVLNPCFRGRSQLAFWIVASFAFYYWGETRIWILFYYIFLNYGYGRFFGKLIQRVWLTSGVILNLLPLFYFKYQGLFREVDVGSLPLGLSFFGFQGISYLVDIKRKACAVEKSLLRYTFFKSFFPPLLAGPIFRYSEIAGHFENFGQTSVDAIEGLQRFIRGLAKKVLIADTLSTLVDLGFSNSSALSFGWAWWVLFTFSLQIYFDFSGYSDMAIGIAQYFNIKIPENFLQPYRAHSVTEFWQRWHCTLTKWLRDYVYYPAGGNRRGPAREYFNKVMVFLLCGLWHGGTWMFAVWGLWHGGLLILESAVKKMNWNFSDRIGILVGRTYVFILVSFSWIFFRSVSWADSMILMKGALGFASTSIEVRDLVPLYHYLNPFFGFVFLSGFVLAWGLYPTRWRALALKSFGLHLVLLAVSFVFLIGASYKPFIYFRF